MKRNENEFAVVAVGASAGGPSALEQVLSKIPEGLRAAFVISQHMPNGFTKAFAERLAEISKLNVKEAEDGHVIRTGDVLIAPAGYNMGISRGGRIQLRKAEVTGPSPSIDTMMQSVADAYGSRSIGVLLTGMLTDGVVGMKAIKDRGGVTIVQDEASSVVYGMPKAALEAGAANYVAAISDIPNKIVIALTITNGRKNS
jgi:two-component system chemotaxis response regulator CheB